MHSSQDETPMVMADAEALLAWLVACGADEAVGEEPVNRFEEPGKALDAKQAGASSAQVAHDVLAGQTQRRAPAPRQQLTKQADNNKDALEKARALAAQAKSLDDLREALGQFEGCSLKSTAHSTVFSDGNPGARVMVIGDAPGRDEDRAGKPFAGQSGQLLDAMFAAIGLGRTEEDPQKALYVTNILPWRPPGNRNPTPEEIALCLPFALRHIALQKPDFIVSLGDISSRQLLETSSGIMRLRGRWSELSVEGQPIPVLPMFSCDYLLRQPEQKRYAWDDLRSLRERIEAS